MRYVRIKVCCIRSVEEARLAVSLGASAIGLVSEMPSGPGVISEDRIAEIAATVPPSIGTFLLTSKQDPTEIVRQQRACRTNTIQLCDELRPGAHQEIRNALPGVSLVQVIHVVGEQARREARQVAGVVDGLLLDSGDRSLPTKELGGTGRTHDWTISAAIVSESPIPVFLAGGLHPGNVGTAIRDVRPFGVDLCSGVRTEGDLDQRKLRKFMAAVSTSELAQ